MFSFSLPLMKQHLHKGISNFPFIVLKANEDFDVKNMEISQNMKSPPNPSATSNKSNYNSISLVIIINDEYF